MILPPMTLAEGIETIRIHRVTGRTGGRNAWVPTRPCRALHQTLSAVGRIGGGPLPRPSEASRAHSGVLFLGARPECRRHVLEVLRQPLGMVKRPWAFTPARAGRFRLTLLRGYGPMAISAVRLGHGYLPRRGFGGAHMNPLPSRYHRCTHAMGIRRAVARVTSRGSLERFPRWRAAF